MLFNCITFAYRICLCPRFSRSQRARNIPQRTSLVTWIVNDLVNRLLCGSINANFRPGNQHILYANAFICLSSSIFTFFFLYHIKRIFKSTICFGLTFTWSAPISVLERKYVNAFFFGLGTRSKSSRFFFPETNIIHYIQVFDTGFNRKSYANGSTNESLIWSLFSSYSSKRLHFNALFIKRAVGI